MAIALCLSGLLVQRLESLCTLRDAAIKQNFEAHFSMVSLDLHLGTCALTTWYHNPDEIHEEIIYPEVIRFWPTIRQALGVMIEHAGSIIKNVAINLT